MNRRNFAKSVLGTLGVSAVASGSVAATQKQSQQYFEAGHQLFGEDGLKITLSKHELGTSNHDRKQFILTFDVDSQGGQLSEKIYRLKDHNGVKHDLFMTPVNQDQLQAVFNWRTHA